MTIDKNKSLLGQDIPHNSHVILKVINNDNEGEFSTIFPRNFTEISPKFHSHDITQRHQYLERGRGFYHSCMGTEYFSTNSGSWHSQHGDTSDDVIHKPPARICEGGTDDFEIIHDTASDDCKITREVKKCFYND